MVQQKSASVKHLNMSMTDAAEDPYLHGMNNKAFRTFQSVDKHAWIVQRVHT